MRTVPCPPSSPSFWRPTTVPPLAAVGSTSELPISLTSLWFAQPSKCWQACPARRWVVNALAVGAWLARLVLYGGPHTFKLAAPLERSWHRVVTALCWHLSLHCLCSTLLSLQPYTSSCPHFPPFAALKHNPIAPPGCPSTAAARTVYACIKLLEAHPSQPFCAMIYGQKRVHLVRNAFP